MLLCVFQAVGTCICVVVAKVVVCNGGACECVCACMRVCARVRVCVMHCGKPMCTTTFTYHDCTVEHQN